ncbi:MAG: type II secretion system protein J [Oscillospiraceae bacterium]
MLKKKLKGFTLVEIIVALAVFSIMSLVVVMIIQMSSSIMKDSQYTTQKANNHGYLADVAAASAETGYDKVSSNQQLTLNGVALTKVDVVTIEGDKVYDSSATGRDESPDSNFYKEAPNIRVFRAGT